MASYGLDQDLAHKIVSKSNYKKLIRFEEIEEPDPIEFTAYAIIGLKNFFLTHPEQFLSRLAKGPPVQYRWLAWKFIGMKLMERTKGDYAKQLLIGRKPESPCKNDITKDVTRTFPVHSYLKDGAFGSYG